jgi:hypothetical protein
VEGGATCGPSAPGFEPGFNLDSGASCVFAAKFELAAVELAPGLATFCLTACRCASANGIAQMATSESRMSALQRRCALIECLVCFFIALSSVEPGFVPELENYILPRDTRFSLKRQKVSSFFS